MRLAAAFLAIAALALGVALYASPASADTITVTREDDPVPDGCAVNGCTFREAVGEANSAGGNQAVDIGDKTITLDSTVTITGDLTVQGRGKDDSSITAGSSGAQLFNIASGGNATFSKVWISGSSTAGPGGCGGAIYNEGTVTLVDTVIAKNYITGKGAGLCNFGTATLEGVTFSANGSTGGPGGALWNAGMMTIAYSTFSQNSVDGDAGGAIANNENGNLTITYSTIDGNTASTGICDDCASGGGIASDGVFLLQHSTVSNNTADNGGGLINRGDARIERSTFTGNTAGAINNSDGTMKITRSTISNNLGAAYPKSGVGGVSNFASLSLLGVTIADNTAMQFQYGGVFTNTTASTDYKSSVFAYNGPFNCSTSGSQTSLGFNVFTPESTNKCKTVGSDKVVDDAGILELADNGGPTWTNLPQAGGAAIDAGGPGCSAPDQRDALILDTHCDAGAVELSGTPSTPTPTPTPVVTPDSFPMGDVTCDDSVTMADLQPFLLLVVGTRAPDQCGRTLLGCFNFGGMCYPPWVDTNCDNVLDARDVLSAAAYLAGVPMNAGGCTPVGEYIGHN